MLSIQGFFGIPILLCLLVVSFFQQVLATTEMTNQEGRTTLSGQSISKFLTYISTGTCPVAPGLLQQLVIWPTWGFGQQALESAKRLRQDNPAPRQVWIPDSHVPWLAWASLAVSRTAYTVQDLGADLQLDPWSCSSLFKRPHNSRQPRAACTLCQQTPSRPPYGLDQECGGERKFSYAALFLWNNLSLPLLQSKSVEQIKTALKTFLFKDHFCWSLTAWQHCDLWTALCHRTATRWIEMTARDYWIIISR